MLKAGYCLQQLGEKQAARRTYQDLIERYPNTEEARLADEKLGEL